MHSIKAKKINNKAKKSKNKKNKSDPNISSGNVSASKAIEQFEEKKSNNDIDDSWNCSVCTFLNVPQNMNCCMCHQGINPNQNRHRNIDKGQHSKQFIKWSKDSGLTVADKRCIANTHNEITQCMVKDMIQQKQNKSKYPLLSTSTNIEGI